MTAPTLTSMLDREAPDAKARFDHNKALAQQLREKVAEAALGGSEKHRERHVSRGKLLNQKKGSAPGQPDGTYFEFLPDEEIFGEYEYNAEYIERRMWNYACLNSGLTLIYNKQKFVTKNVKTQ